MTSYHHTSVVRWNTATISVGFFAYDNKQWMLIPRQHVKKTSKALADSPSRV